jgi:hypothetical protein
MTADIEVARLAGTPGAMIWRVPAPSASADAQRTQRLGTFMPAGNPIGGRKPEVPMTTQVASQAAVRTRRPAVSPCAPILAAKITVPGVPDWAVAAAGRSAGPASLS